VTEQHSNLAPDRGPSVWKRQSLHYQNLEKWLPAMAGGLMLLTGLRQRSAFGAALSFAGAALVYRTATGRDDLREAKEWLGSEAGRLRTGRRDRVADDSADSFPASDSPSWTPTTGV
jgi:uncharacterized membrane protein